MSDDHSIIPAEVVAVTPSQGRQMSPVVQAMVAQATSPETIRELLSVQREWEAGEARKAYTRALVDLKRDLPAVLARDKRVSYGSGNGAVGYTHTSLAAAVEATASILSDHGFSLSWEPSTADERAVRVTCRLTHREGHSEACALSAPPDAKGSKSPAQAIASTVTLLQRYTMLSLLGIATADMRDPTPPQEPDDQVDPKRNLNAAAALRKAGRDVAAVERQLGRSVKEWTKADRDRVRAMIEPRREAGEEG